MKGLLQMIQIKGEVLIYCSSGKW